MLRPFQRQLTSDTAFLPDSERGLLRRIRRPMTLLILAHVSLLHLALYAMTLDLPRYRWPCWQSLFIAVVALCQIALLGCWCALGRSPWGARIGMSSLGATLCVVALRACELNHERWLTVALLQLTGICAMLLTMRFVGYRLVNLKVPGAATSETDGASSRRLRFSLLQLLICMSVSSLLVGLSQILRAHEVPAVVNRGDDIRAPGLAIALAAIAVTMVWATLSAQRSIYAIAVALLVLLGACWSVGKLDQSFRTSWWSSLGPAAYERAYWLLLGWYSLVLLVTFRVVRSAGYRMGRSFA